MISNGERSVIEEVADSSSSSSCQSSNAPSYCGNVSTFRFKGVVPQQNGHWGSQIYANHQRIWLGTFKSEKEAALAYDSAALKLRSCVVHRNFPFTGITAVERNFQSHYSTESVLNMIKDGTYASRFSDFMKTTQPDTDANEFGHNIVESQKTDGDFILKQLFDKELKPSDVGRLNRLVIPKKHAVKFFPSLPGSISESSSAGKSDDTELEFYDTSMKRWKFRYCYWRSSQSYVFTRGWGRYAREKQLKPKDVIIFYLCRDSNPFFMIDVKSSNLEAKNKHFSTRNVGLQLQIGQGNVHIPVPDDQATHYKTEETFEAQHATQYYGSRKGFKLFGVQII
ncbi:hypothetical protein K2173_020954 [Erythroxylum novogranatense]|uniref:Uncharacterized protein n=1 Tax=Erythroxylum novogranatense TaxID=1862640 RepID=A0AAV8TQ22_9ROSI|nr:hypothetical protein K2173_020954 [Erythroxylum novogranatense]